MLVPTVYVENATILRYRCSYTICDTMFGDGDIELGICSTTNTACEYKFFVMYFLPLWFSCHSRGSLLHICCCHMSYFMCSIKRASTAHAVCIQVIVLFLHRIKHFDSVELHWMADIGGGKCAII